MHATYQQDGPTFPGNKVAVLIVVPVQEETTHKIVHFSNDWTVLEEISHNAGDICHGMYQVCVQSGWFDVNLCQKNIASQ